MVFINMKLNYKNYLLFGIVVMLVFFSIKTSVLLEIIDSSRITRGVEYFCLLIFIPTFYFINRSHIRNQKFKLEENDKFLNASSIISITDKHGKITFVNKKFEEISGYKLDEVLGKGCWHGGCGRDTGAVAGDSRHMRGPPPSAGGSSAHQHRPDI